MSIKPLSERAFEVLRWLDDEIWVRPMDVGGHDGSHHSQTLTRLVRHGLAERTRPGMENGVHGGRGGWKYRRTQAGRIRVYGARPADRPVIHKQPGSIGG